jgi:hypothetical protein
VELCRRIAAVESGCTIWEDRGILTAEGETMRIDSGSSVVALPLIVCILFLSACGSATPKVVPETGGAAIPTTPTSPSEIEGCVPACVSGITQPGNLPEGEYQTAWFFGGEMLLTFDAGWMSEEDSTSEFSVMSLAAPENGIVFWEDVYPLEDGKRVNGVPLTAAGLLDWLRSSFQVDVSGTSQGAIGDLPATVIDVSVAPDAANEEDNAYCRKRTCVLFLGFPQWDEPWGIAGDQVQRFYLSDVSYGGAEHLFVAVVYPDDPAEMKAFASTGEQLLATVRVPAIPSA